MRKLAYGFFQLLNSMNLPKTRKIILLIGTILIVGLVFYVFVNREKVPQITEAAPPVPKPIIEIPGNDISTLSTRFSISESLFPTVKKLSVYSWEDTPIFSNFSEAAAFAASLDLKDYQAVKDVFDGEIYLFTQDSAGLSTPKSFAQLSYLDGVREGSYVQSSSASIPSKEEAVEEAKKFIDKNGFDSSLLSVNEATLNYLQYQKSEPPLFPTNSKDEARAVQVEFQMAINNYPIYAALSREYAMQFVIGPAGKVIGLKMRNLGKVGEVLGEYPLKNRQEAVAALEAGEGKLVFTNDIPLGDLKEFTATKAYLAYLQSKEETLQPIFVLEGFGVVGESKMDKVILYLPAIADKYLQ